MDHDTILQSMSPREFESEVKEAFQCLKEWLNDNKLGELIDCSLGQSSLLIDCLLVNETAPLDGRKRARCLEALLHWATAQIRPYGEPNVLEPSWRRYYSLRDLYLEGWTATRVANKLELYGGDSKLYTGYVNPAIAEVARIIQHELLHPSDVKGRKWHLIDRRYHSHTSEEKHTLRLLASFHRPVSYTLVQRMAQEAEVNDFLTCIDDLYEDGLIIRSDDKTEETLLVHPEVLAYLKRLKAKTSREQQINWHKQAAYNYEFEKKFADAAYHYLEIGEYALAAELLIKHYKEIANRGDVKQFGELLHRFKPEDLDELTRIQLSIAAGDAYMIIKDFDSALIEYGKALAATDIYHKALAFHHRAKALEAKHADEAIEHYERGIELLQPRIDQSPSYPQLLIELYIDEAWAFIQLKADAEQAEGKLTCAQALVSHCDNSQRVRLHNGWARLFEKSQDNLERYLYFARKANVLAEETQDSELIWITSHNLGMGYIWNGESELGLYYLQKALGIAQQAGNRTHEANCYKTIGAGYFFQEQFQEAIRYYKLAYNIFREVGDRMWLGYVCHDLAEAYAVIGLPNEMMKYFTEAAAIAEEVNHQELRDLLTKLADQHKGLVRPKTGLNQRQLLAYEYVKLHSKINKREYIDLINNSELEKIAERQATRDLQDLVDKGLFIQKERGPAAHYVLSSAV